MKYFKNITYSLLAVISFSLISVSAHAGGYGFRIGAYGNGFHVGYNNYYPSAYYGYHRPVVKYRHHYRPYYPDHRYRHKHHSGHHQSYNAHNKHGSGHNSRRHHNQRNYHHSNNRYSNHGNSRIASSRSHR